ncbi:30S ribosomal protein S19e [Acidilobus saccharovorans 345-15]|uniref:Small ribosomal subunit protein eS19 n=1 Tax=Acidilobus saccharovorans (strain DSM 16705 / JCM 18335 / VKM B-2471 / 345-15) TaxID=666510 RepID=D9Q2T0_ACIS3|nr:30S ribosomal protein S19e [Acidilobus saccharovorans 345-15]
MVTVADVPADKFIERLAARLKNIEQVKPPEWTLYAKTGVSRERPPDDPNWWYTRAASILRKLYLSEEPIGVGAFRVIYGGRKRNGVRPAHFAEGGGSNIRRILQQLEQAGLVKSTGRGRVLSPKGRSLLDEVAKEIANEIVKERPELAKYF